jgi:Zn-dependent protease
MHVSGRHGIASRLQFMVHAMFIPGSLPLLAMIDLKSPIVLAVLVGWVLSVTLHELAHGVVAYMGGDYTIRERGGITLNPLQYIDPLLSIVMPLIFLLMGGMPLPGGVTYIRRDLLRSRLWDTAVSLAGPAVNILLSIACVLPFHPRIGWIHLSMWTDVSQLTPVQQFLCSMAVLQFLVGMLNLLPIPPLDGFGAIRPYFDLQTQAKLSNPQVAYAGLIIVAMFLPARVFQAFYSLQDEMLSRLGFHSWTIQLIGAAFNKVVIGR